MGKVGKVKPTINNDYCPFLEFTNHLYDKELETSNSFIEKELKNLPGLKLECLA